MIALFRQIERWLHQHIFKVGWLITNNFQTTTILYYILFLPGILLHELTVWLIAGLIGVRADRAVDFPERQEIGELRLNFIRVSPQAGNLRYALIRLAPLIAGMVCLWAIAAHIFRLQEAAILSPAGSIDELARAVTRLTGTADFWLWFYLAFTVANTMVPSQNTRLSARRKSVLILALAASLLFAWRVGGAIEVAIARGVEILVGSLILVALQVILIDVVVVLGLGALESLIERLTGKSATFADGKMITMSRQEAHEHKRVQTRKRLAARKQQQPESKRAEIIRSVYDLKLPIPGPPGREPVSRSIVAVLNINDSDVDASPYSESLAHAPGSTPRSTVSLEQSAPVQLNTAERRIDDRTTTENEDLSSAAHPPAAATGRPVDDPLAPFSRPFARASSGRHADDDMTDQGDKRASGEFFPRPFSMKTRSFGEPDTADISPANSDRVSASDSEGEGRDVQPRVRARRTRPAPKPSASGANDDSASTLSRDDELTYEPLDDEEVFADDEDQYDDTPPSS